jgi:hypothetical protein
MLEDAIEGRLHKTVWLQDGNVSFSVSRVHRALSDCIVGFWFMVSFYVGWKYLREPLPSWPTLTPRVFLVILLTVLALGGVGLLFRRTDLKRSSIPDVNGNHGPSWQPPRLVWRFWNAEQPQPPWRWWQLWTTVGEQREFVRRYARGEPAG